MGVLRAHGALAALVERQKEYIEAAHVPRRFRARASSSATCCPIACRRSSSWPPFRSRTRSCSRRRFRSWAWACPSPSHRWGCSSPTGSSTCCRASTGSASIPGIALLLAIVAINLVADQLRDVLNPRLQQVSTRLLEVDGLRTHFFTKAGVVKAVDDVTFAVRSWTRAGTRG